MVKMVIYHRWNDKFFSKNLKKGEISAWNWSEWLYNDLGMTKGAMVSLEPESLAKIPWTTENYLNVYKMILN